MLVLGANADRPGAGDILTKIGNAETAFALLEASFGVNDFRVNQCELGLGIFLEGHVDDRNAARDANLRCS